MFTNNGFFLNEVQFENSEIELNSAEISKLISYNIGKAFKNLNKTFTLAKKRNQKFQSSEGYDTITEEKNNGKD